MTTSNAPPVSKRPSEPNDSNPSQIVRFDAMLIIHHDMTTTNAPPVSKLPSELNDPKSLQIVRFSAILIIQHDNNKCTIRF